MSTPSNPIQRSQAVRARIDALVEYLRSDVQDMDEPQAKALFETAAETLGGLKEAFADYEKKNEAAWDE